MEPSFLQHYERELKHVREMSGEFARQFPKVASRLGLDAFSCADPYVERLIQSFAYLTARIQLKLESAHGAFTEHMLQLLYPNYTAPTPSMAVMQLLPNAREGSLTTGVVVPRGSVLRNQLSRKEATACEFRTAHDVTLLPIELESADYRAKPAEFLPMERVGLPNAQAALRLVLRTQRGASFDALSFDKLPLYLRGLPIAPRIYEQLLSGCIGIAVQSAARPSPYLHILRRRPVAALGFQPDHALLPCGNREFQGYRLLQEYFAFPERFLFVELRELAALLRKAAGERIELILLFNRLDQALEGVVKADHFALFCTPAINLFPHVADRVHLDPKDQEHHVVADRMRPHDFEVHSVTKVVGYGDQSDALGEFTPMYVPSRNNPQGRGGMHYTVRRKARPLRSGLLELEQDPHNPYVPSETFLSLVDGSHGQGRPGLRQLSVETLCTNRALPLLLSTRGAHLKFEELSGAPISAVHCLAGPTRPRASPAFGDVSWGLLSHVSLDFLTLTKRPDESASALRQLLGLYASLSSADNMAQIEGIVAVQTRGVVRPLAMPGPMTFGRGIEISLTCDERAFEGTGPFLLAAVLEQFFAKYASINSFTETVLKTQQRGEVMRWPTTLGQRTAL